MQVSADRPTILDDSSTYSENSSSGVSWSAVCAGAFVASALSLVLLALGAGLGLSSISPWSQIGSNGSAVSKAAIAWLILNEVVSSFMGGYLAGRLRIKWAKIHTDEVYFRDTAHGFLVWAVAVVVTSAFLAAAATSMVGSMSSSASVANMGSAITADSEDVGPQQYFVDSLFRSGHSQLTSSDFASVHREAERILQHALSQGEMAEADNAYLSQLVSSSTQLTGSAAEKRVADVYAQARTAIDMARKATAHLLLWLFLALLIGAFSASYAATVGGSQRDHVV